MKEKLIKSGGNIAQKGQSIILTQAKRFGATVADFKAAVTAAENVDYSTRWKLYDLYTNALQDTHLSSVINKRSLALLATKIRFRRNGEADDAINAQIQSPWFKRCINDILDSRWWGFSLLQFYRQGEWLDYENIPRKHVDPIKELVLRRQHDISGIPWSEYTDLLFVGEKRGLGLLYKVIPWVIYKMNDAADWATFAELYGMPIEEWVYDSDDDTARDQAYKDASNRGGGATYVHAKNSSLKLHDSSSKSGSAELYERLWSKCDSEVSKLILGNTLTTEVGDKGTQALGTVHKEEEDRILNADREFVLDVLNFDMADIFAAMGLNTAGGEFYFDVPADVVPLKERLEIVKTLKQTCNLPISDDYLYETFGIEKPDNYEALKSEKQPQSEPARVEPTSAAPSANEANTEPQNAAERSFLAKLRDFFAWAPKDLRGEDHLDW